MPRVGGSFCDLLWSDTDNIETLEDSPGGAGYLFGWKVADEFNHIIRLD